MEWDIGLRGLALLMVYALGFGLLAQLFSGRSITRWMWLIATTVFFVSGLLSARRGSDRRRRTNCSPSSTGCRATS